jgi:UDPglucose 6-dehydrogenase
MKLCMIGTGYVGLVSGTCFSELGNNVVCVDNDTYKINRLNSGIIPIYEPGLDELIKRNKKQNRLKFSTNINESIKKSDIIFICVGTPTDKKTNNANLRFVFQVAKSIKKNLNKYKIVVTKSTVPVTTGDKIEKIFQSKLNKNRCDVVSNPEFLREGEAIRDFMYPDRVVIGTNSKKANNIMKNLYLPIIKKSRYFHTSRRSAEMIKYASNAFLATKISFINELANLSEKLNIDVQNIATGMGLDERIGERFLRPGPGYGGSCFPKDTRALITTAKKFDTKLSIINTVVKFNNNRFKDLNNRIVSILNNKIKNKRITFLGVTFKANTDDMRDSPSLKMIPKLLKKGALINYYEPTGKKMNFNNYKNVTYSASISEACLKSDLIIIHTEWNEFKQLNFKKIVGNNRFKIFDMRNLYSSREMLLDKINYFAIGR